jgi:hypothetical protein
LRDQLQCDFYNLSSILKWRQTGKRSFGLLDKNRSSPAWEWLLAAKRMLLFYLVRAAASRLLTEVVYE